MKKYSGIIKNIIMVVASALTLVAVSFAWFTTNFKTNLDSYEAVVEGETLIITYYKMDENGTYQPLEGDINLENVQPGDFNKYKIEIITKTSDKLKMNFAIQGLSKTVPQTLKDNVCFKYSLYSQRKKVNGNDGSVSYVDQVMLSQSSDYVTLSDISDNNFIFQALNLSNYQTSAADRFVIYYEIGLSEDAPSTLSGLEYDIGGLSISAQRIG